MNEEEKLRIQGNQPYLVENIRVIDIQDILLQEFILNEEDDEILTNTARNESTRAAARKLLSILKKSPNPNCYKVFCNALNEQGYEHVVETLKATDINKIKEKALQNKQQLNDNLENLNKQVWIQNEMMMSLKMQVDSMQEKYKKYDELEGAMKEKGMSSERVVKMLINYMSKGGFSPEIGKGGDAMQKNMFPNPQVPSAPIPSTAIPSKAKGAVEQSDDVASEISKRLTEIGDGVTEDELYVTSRPNSVESQQKVRKQSIGVGSSSLARDIGKDIVFYLVAKKNGLSVHDPPNEYASAMRKMVDDLIEAHEEMFEKTLRELDLQKYVGFQAIITVFDELFSEGANNWGRIVTLYAYGGYIAVNSGFKLDDPKSWPRIGTLGDFLGYYVDEKLDDWIQQSGGWVSNIFFKNE